MRAGTILREAQPLPDQRPVHTEAGSLHQVESQTAPAEEDVERVESRGHVVALDPGDRRLWDACLVRELALCQPGTLPCLSKDRPRSHLPR